MTPGRATSLLQGQTALARKVYDSVPIGSFWSGSEIQTQHAKRYTPIPHRTFMGCIRALIDAGLVKSNGDVLFRRTEIKEASVPEITGSKKPATPVPSLAEPKPATLPAKTEPALDRLNTFVDALRTQMKVVNETVAAIEHVVVEIHLEAEQNVEMATKLKQLQTLLKGLT